ncbi:hypothetical protein CDD83_7462 [Cordyceps sp. RAO-2017]|nr:hypothetical protein CDD83_7462 [Cordyceps sp. RAO-2017]
MASTARAAAAPARDEAQRPWDKKPWPPVCSSSRRDALAGAQPLRSTGLGAPHGQMDSVCGLAAETRRPAAPQTPVPCIDGRTWARAYGSMYPQGLHVLCPGIGPDRARRDAFVPVLTAGTVGSKDSGDVRPYDSVSDRVECWRAMPDPEVRLPSSDKLLDVGLALPRAAALWSSAGSAVGWATPSARPGRLALSSCFQPTGAGDRIAAPRDDTRTKARLDAGHDAFAIRLARVLLSCLLRPAITTSSGSAPAGCQRRRSWRARRAVRSDRASSSRNELG